MKNMLNIAFWVICLPLLSHAQELWPRVLKANDGSKITIYQPQPEKLDGKILIGRTAISVQQKSAPDPVFGALWFKAEMETNRENRMAVLQKLQIDRVKIPGIEDSLKIMDLQKLLET